MRFFSTMSRQERGHRLGRFGVAEDFTPSQKSTLMLSVDLLLTAKLAIGSRGANAVRLAAVEPRQKLERSSKNHRTEELRVQLWRRQWSATLRDAQLTAKLALGSCGENVVRLAAVEPRREDEMSP